MKKIFNGKGLAVVGLFVLCGFCTGCLTLMEELSEPTNGERAGGVSLHWQLGGYVDDWGDKTGEHYVYYLKDVSALYTGMGYKDETGYLSGLKFSETEGLLFHVNENFSSHSASDVLFNIKFADDTKEEFLGYLRRSSANDGNIIFIPYSEKLVKTLSQENITVRFAIKQSGYFYQFKFPAQFKEAYELLENSKKTPSGKAK